MIFKEFRDMLAKHVATMFKQNRTLFRVEYDRDGIWEHYLGCFPDGSDPMFRERTEHDCQCCKAFIRQFGNVIAIHPDTFEVVSIWDLPWEDGFEDRYRVVAEAMAAWVKGRPIESILATNEGAVGTQVSHGQNPETQAIEKWHHFHIEIPSSYRVRDAKTLGTLMSHAKAAKDVLRRSLEEISPDAIDTLLDLIAQKSLYKGEEWEGALNQLKRLQSCFRSLDASVQDAYCWRTSQEVGVAVSKIRNHSIGVLLQDVTAGVELDEAVKRYEKIVAPTNYKRPKAIFTKRMLEQAQKQAEELGLLDSLPRRFAHLEDITVNNVLFANRAAATRMAGSVFEELADVAQTGAPRDFSRAEEIGVDDFITGVLPRAQSVEVLFENQHVSNLVSLIAPVNPEAAPLFKWGNNFGWAYNGNITDSMKERVKNMGGRVEGVLRFSIQWNENGGNENDFDAHCKEPRGHTHIYYQNKGRVHPSSGMLDVDIINPSRDARANNGVAVENIIYTDKRMMPGGTYTFSVVCYTDRGGLDGFRAEIEFDGRIYQYSYPRAMRTGEEVVLARVKYTKTTGVFEIQHELSAEEQQLTVWGLKTQQFIPAQAVMFSPNHWDDKGIGHRHLFFMLQGCQNDSAPNGFFNEFLRDELRDHRRVFEALGSKMRVEPDENQLSGVGFSVTKHDAVVCRVQGNTNRVLKVVL
jgi:hypothetical protein